MADLMNAKKDFILSLKQLRLFFNNLKDVHGQHDTTLEKLEDKNVLALARLAMVHNEKALLASPNALQEKQQQLQAAFKFQETQQTKLKDCLANLDKIDVSQDELNVKVHPEVKYFEQSIEVMGQAQKFTDLINLQENDSLKRQIQAKQKVVDSCDSENKSLQAQLDLLLQQIEEKKAQERQVRADIQCEEQRTAEVIRAREEMIQQCQNEIADTRQDYEARIKSTYDEQDKICHQQHQLQAQIEFLKQRNALLYFYPVKVKGQQESLERKRQELELYQGIIDRTFEFITERIEENEKKQMLVQELNQYVGGAIRNILEDEREFYESQQKDRLKVPPYNMVKRIPRDYQAETEKVVRGNNGRGQANNEMRDSNAGGTELKEQDDFAEYDDEEDMTQAEMAQHWQK